MPAPPTNDAVRTARTALAAADDAEAAGLDWVQQATIALRVAQRLQPGTDVEAAAQQELTEAQRALDQDLRPAVAARRAALQAALTAWFDGVTVDADIARLPAFVPIDLLSGSRRDPVRSDDPSRRHEGPHLSGRDLHPLARDAVDRG